MLIRNEFFLFEAMSNSFHHEEEVPFSEIVAEFQLTQGKFFFQFCLYFSDIE